MWKTAANSLFLIIFILLTTACSSLPDQQNINGRAEKAAEKSSKSSHALLQQAKSKLQKAQTESLAFYAPTYLQQAQAAYDDAHKLYNQKADASTTKQHAQLSIEWVAAGMRNKKMVREYLSASLANRSVLIKLHAEKHFPEDYAKIQTQHLELIKQIEQRKESQAQQDEKTLILAMRSLEVTTIGKTYLGKSYQMLKQAEALNAQQHLPKIYHDALAQLRHTEQYIRENPRNKKIIKGLANDNLFTTERLFSLARLAANIQKAKDTNVETLVLQQEAHLQRITKALNYKDIRNLSLEDQSLLLSRHGEQLSSKRFKHKNRANSQQELEKWKRKVVLLQSELRHLEKQTSK